MGSDAGIWRMKASRVALDAECRERRAVRYGIPAEVKGTRRGDPAGQCKCGEHAEPKEIALRVDHVYHANG